MVGVGTVAIVFYLVGVYRVPETLKPEWLKEEERLAPQLARESRVDRLADLAVIAIPLAFLAVAVLSGVLLLLTTILR
jgi:hypothetical protein